MDGGLTEERGNFEQHPSAGHEPPTLAYKSKRDFGANDLGRGISSLVQSYTGDKAAPRLIPADDLP